MCVCIYIWSLLKSIKAMIYSRKVGKYANKKNLNIAFMMDLAKIVDLDFGLIYQNISICTGIITLLKFE